MRSQGNLSDVKAIVLDVDGVLTDGRIGYSASEDEIKFFNVKDGQGIKFAMRAGLKVGILSGRRSKANEVRAKELGLSFIVEGCHDKKEGFLKLLEEQKLEAEECMYVGDDLVDVPPMRLAGFAVAVGDGVKELDEVAHLRTQAKGGKGAVREAIEFLLKGQGKWDKVVSKYFL